MNAELPRYGTGILLVMLATVGWSLAGVFVRFLPGLDGWQINCWRGFWMSVFLLVYLVAVYGGKTASKFLEIPLPALVATAGFFTAGSTLYLPVFQPGAQFFTGDGHALQGDGEVNGTAIEISLAPTLQFIVHPGAGRSMRWPRAEDAQCHYVMAMSEDLNEATRMAIEEGVAFLEQRAGLTTAKAYALSSLAVDFRIAEAVNGVKVVYGAIPKAVLRERG